MVNAPGAIVRTNSAAIVKLNTFVRNISSPFLMYRL